jgi:hypothetical protein
VGRPGGRRPVRAATRVPLRQPGHPREAARRSGRRAGAAGRRTGPRPGQPGRGRERHPARGRRGHARLAVRAGRGQAPGGRLPGAHLHRLRSAHVPGDTPAPGADRRVQHAPARHRRLLRVRPRGPVVHAGAEGHPRLEPGPPAPQHRRPPAGGAAHRRGTGHPGHRGLAGAAAAGRAPLRPAEPGPMAGRPPPGRPLGQGIRGPVGAPQAERRLQRRRRAAQTPRPAPGLSR